MKKYFFLSVLFIFNSILFSQWTNQPINTGFNLFACSFPSVNTGFVVGYGNTIFRTNDGGTNWTNLSFAGTGNNINSVWFINENTGWISSTNDTLYMTTNNGASWNASFNLQNQGGRIFFINQTTGWAMGTPKLFKTTNSGSSWNLINANVGTDFFFLNENTGWMTTYSSGSSTVNKTSDGGTTWISQFSTVNFRSIYSIYFTDINTGWITGYRECIYKTTNSGGNWTEQRDQNNSIGLYSSRFINSNTGWVTGDNGKALNTTDGGTTWNSVVLSGSRMEDVKFVDQNTGWIVGDNGKIFKTTNFGGITGIDPVTSIAENFNLSQNYPNPFNPTTKITFEIPGLDGNENIRSVQLKVFDVLGKEVAVLVDQNMNAGKYEINFNAVNLPSGVYFYKLETEGFTDVKKMLFIK